MTPQDMWSLLSQIDPVAKLINLFSAAGNGDQVAKNYLSSLARDTTAKAANDAVAVADKALVGALTFMSDNGSTIALACYATGNIEIGLIVDGVTLASGIALDVREFSSSGDMKKLAVELGKTGVNFTFTSVTGEALMKNVKFSDREIESVVNFVTEMQGIILDETLN